MRLAAAPAPAPAADADAHRLTNTSTSALDLALRATNAVTLIFRRRYRRIFQSFHVRLASGVSRLFKILSTRGPAAESGPLLAMNEGGAPKKQKIPPQESCFPSSAHSFWKVTVCLLYENL